MNQKKLISVSIMQRSDYPAVLEHREISASCWVGKTSETELSNWDHAMGDPKENVFLLKCKGRIIGSARLALYENDPEVAQIVPLVIDPAERNKGLGLYFLQWLKQYCRDNAFTALRLSVDQENHTALRLYERAGFVEDGEVEIEDNYNMVEMKLKL
jgi:GNAT superfamily N-acetyltransferase